MLLNDKTPEYMFCTGSGVREPSATSLALWFLLYLTANIKFTMNFVGWEVHLGFFYG